MGLGEPRHRLFLCAGLLLAGLVLQLQFGDALSQNNDLTFDTLSHGGGSRSSRSLEDVHSKSSHGEETEEGNWISSSLHRIKRGFFDTWFTTTEAPPAEDDKSAENNSVEGQSQTLVEGDSNEELEPPEEDEDGGYDSLAFGSSNSRETRPSEDIDDDDDDEVYNSGHHSGESNPEDDNLSQHPTYYRIWFTLMEPFSDRWSPDEYKRTSEQIVDNIDQLYKDFGGNQSSNVVQIKGRPEDMFTSLVTVDLKSVNFNNAFAIRRKIEDQINNYNVIGSLHVKPDDFRFLEFEDEPTKLCTSNELECKSGQCVPIAARCNTVSDCTDGTDEENCPPDVGLETDIDLTTDELLHSTEGPAGGRDASSARPDNRCRGDDSLPCGENPTVFICADQECDGEPDCPNGEDEDAVKCGYEKPCAVGELSCDIRRCIPESQRCDGRFDCEDQTDEHGCPAIACQSDQFRCDDGRCIDNSQRCDNRPDCSRGEDEFNCPPPTRGCTDTEFECALGICIEDYKRCNHIKDCPSGNDEENCSSDTAHTPKPPTCRFRCHDGSCAEHAIVCDGIFDCVDGTDESNCGVCGPHQFKCSTGDCIADNQRCDGRRDCSDGTDEDGCVHQCPHDQFRCGNGLCLNRQMVCDGYPDCSDQSDEANCIRMCSL